MPTISKFQSKEENRFTLSLKNTTVPSKSWLHGTICTETEWMKVKNWSSDQARQLPTAQFMQGNPMPILSLLLYLKEKPYSLWQENITAPPKISKNGTT